MKIIPNYNKAMSIALRNKKSDPSWDYKVVSTSRGFVVEVYDENSNKVGVL